MKDNKNKKDELGNELAKLEEFKNKQLYECMWVLFITLFTFYAGIIFLAAFTLGEGLLFGVVVSVSTITMVIVAFYGLKVEVDVGYYECGKCHHKYVPGYLKAAFSPHVGTIRYLKCPKCDKKSWSKKSMIKD